jgi:transposase
VRVFVARCATDLRRSFDRLSAKVHEILRQNPFSGHVFVFFNRQRNRVKMLVWERGRVMAAVQAAGVRDLRGAGAR